MTQIQINGKNYNFETLPDTAKQQVQSIQFIDSELQRLRIQAAVFQTARSAYTKALQETLATVESQT
jgi:hypothetical protein